jgi:MFS family permease
VGAREDAGPLNRRVRAAISAVFLINGLQFSSWAARIPSVKERAGLSDARLGIALAAMAVGTFLALPISGAVMARFGSRAVTGVSVLATCLALPLAGLAQGLPSLFLALAYLGASLGAVDVSMNAQASALEKAAGRSLMASFHGLWSVGALVGATLGGRLAASGVAPALHFAALSLTLVPLGMLAARGLAAEPPAAGERPPILAWPARAVVRVGLMTACAAIVEGGIADWSGVYLRGLGTGPGAAAAGYAAFSLAMAVGRVGAADRLIDAVGPAAVLRAGTLTAALALACGLLLHRPAVAVAAFAACGLGMAGVFPIAFSAAAKVPGTVPSTAIAAVATMAYGASLAGPPGIGFLATLTSLPLALALLVLLCLLITLTARRAIR